MTFNIGVNVVEVEGTASPTIVPAPVSVAGFLVRSRRGIPNRPVLVRSFADFVSAFGSYREDAYGAHAVSGFFQNGGSEAWISRVVGPSPSAAAVPLTASGATVLDVSAGMRGVEDPGEWGRELRVRVDDDPRGTTTLPAQLRGSTGEPFALTAGSGLAITVTGAPAPIAVAFAPADFGSIASATAAEVARIIDRASPALRAVATPDHHILLSAVADGPNVRIAVAAPAAGADASTILGFNGPNANTDGGIAAANSTTIGVSSPAGFDPGAVARIETRGRVVGATAPGAAPTPSPSGIDVKVDGGAATPIRFATADFVSPARLVGAINDQAAGRFTAATTPDGKLVLMSNSWGAGSQIQVVAAAGVTDAAAALGLTGATPADGGVSRRLITAVSESERLVSLDAVLTADLLPAFARLRSGEFRLSVLSGAASGPAEVWEGLSLQPGVPNYAPAVINDADAGSRLILVTDPNAGATGVKPVPGPQTAALTGGGEGTPTDAAWVGDAAARTGLYAFDTVRIQLLACPETESPGVVAGALAYCESRGDAMFVGTAPRDHDADGVKAYAAPLRAKKVYGALYSPWLLVSNPVIGSSGPPQLYVPPVGHVLGVYARMAAAAGVWRAPAGDDAVVNFALGVKFGLTDADLTDLVENGGVNGIRAVPGSGIVIDASRTLSTDTRWRYVNVRRLFNFVKVSLRDSLRFVAQEPHDEALRRRVRFNVVLPFLLGLWSQGAFGSDPAEQVFTVRCDASNNTPADVQQGKFTLEVFFYPVKPAEKIIITVGQQDSGAAASER